MESIYQDCLVIELARAGIQVSREHPVPIEYHGQRLRRELKVDLLVDGRLVVEVKSVDRLHPVHQAK